nr:hypothetical protein [Streptomyces tsukubensis NRRL18488]
MDSVADGDPLLLGCGGGSKGADSLAPTLSAPSSLSPPPPQPAAAASNRVTSAGTAAVRSRARAVTGVVGCMIVS